MIRGSSRETRVPRVLLAGHLPPPMSGIGTYYQILLNSSLPRRVSLRFIDTSLRRRPGSETGIWSFSNVIFAIEDCVRFAGAMIVFRPETCHIATSVGLSLLKHSICVAMARLTGRRVLLHPHCSFGFFYERHGRAWQWFVRKIIGICQGVVVLSREWMRLQEAVPNCRIYYLPNAINISAYVEIGCQRIASKNEKRSLNILYLGHLGQAKGSFDLICAAKTVVAQGYKVNFELVGHEQVPGDIERLNAQVSRIGLGSFVHIRSAVAGEEKIRLLRSADLFVYPSYYEGMPMAVIEAMACGLAIVATQVGGLPDLVRPGVNGLLVPAGQPDQLAAAITQLIVDPQMRHRMQQDSLRMAREDFDIEKLVSQLVEIYQVEMLLHHGVLARY